MENHDCCYKLTDKYMNLEALFCATEKEMGKESKDEAGSDLVYVSEIMIKPGNESEVAQVAPGIHEFQEQSDLTSDTLVDGNESSASQKERFNSEPSEVIGISVRNKDGDVGQSLRSSDNGSEIAGTFQTMTSSESSEEADGTEILEPVSYFHLLIIIFSLISCLFPFSIVD